MANELMPLYYAILKQFMDGEEYGAGEIIDELKPLYGSYKLLTKKDIEEALATAKENALLDESSFDLDENGELRIRYRVNDFGRDMIDRYIGKYSNPKV